MPLLVHFLKTSIFIVIIYWFKGLGPVLLELSYDNSRGSPFSLHSECLVTFHLGKGAFSLIIIPFSFPRVRCADRSAKR